MKCKYYSECLINRAIFAYAKTDKVRVCKKHKLKGMIDVKNVRCLQEGCSKQPMFNVIGSKKRLYCSKHKLDGMIDVISKRCDYEGCVVRPSYNFEGSKSCIYCAEHKLDGMIDLVSKRCEHEGCTIRASFNFEGLKSRIYCAEHKLKGMVDVVSKRCEHEGCISQASFNLEGTKSGLYCSEHKLKNMININNTYCQYEGCSITASFNVKGETRGIYCAEHKDPDMISTTNKLCILCDMITAKSHYDDHCYGCFSFKYPNHPRVKNYKTKEQAIMSEIAKVYSNIILDKAISGGCSRKRPDGLIDLLTHVIIVEVDENQHKDYDTLCDNKRTMMLYQDLAHRPIVFIRVNPDKYKVKGKNMSGAFSITKASGSLKTHPRILKQRIEATLIAIKRNVSVVPSRAITVESLFFDDYDPEDIHIHMNDLTI